MKSFILLLILSISYLMFSCTTSAQNAEFIAKEKEDLFPRTKAKADEALAYCKTNKFNTDFCILIDLRIHSGLKRFFVWDFNKDTIIDSFLVSHGCGSNPWATDYTKENPVFSNEDGSHCSSLGKYKIGQRAYSNWGVNIKYVLHGLEKTNNNALARYIVFHSWEATPTEEIYPEGTPEGWGCPTLSNEKFQLLDPILQGVKSPVLMWLYSN